MLAELWNKNKFYIQGTKNNALSLLYSRFHPILSCFPPLYLKPWSKLRVDRFSALKSPWYQSLYTAGVLHWAQDSWDWRIWQHDLGTLRNSNVTLSHAPTLTSQHRRAVVCTEHVQHAHRLLLFVQTEVKQAKILSITEAALLRKTSFCCWFHIN